MADVLDLLALLFAGLALIAFATGLASAAPAIGADIARNRNPRGTAMTDAIYERQSVRLRARFANGAVLVEIGAGQAEAVSGIAREAGFRVILYRDLAARPRALALTHLQ